MKHLGIKFQSKFSILVFIIVAVFGIMVFTSIANSAPCRITIEKTADPSDETEFDFSIIGNFDFELMDGGTQQFSVIVNGSSTVTEEVPDGWILDDIVCSEIRDVDIDDAPPSGVIITCLDDLGGATCTFSNSLAPAIPAMVPTLSEWGLISMAGVLGIIGFLVIRRRKVTA